MKQYTTIHPLFMSFYSRSLYRDVGRNWKKISYLYLLLLLAVCLIPVMFKTHSLVSAYVLQKAPGIVRQVPPITITKGQVSTSVQMPYIIKDPESNAPLVIIDTTGQTTSLKGSAAFVLLTKTNLQLKKDPTETRTLDLSSVDNLVIDQSVAYDWIGTFLDYFIFVLYPLALIFSYALRIIQALIFAVVGMGIARSLRLSLRISSLMSLSIVSMTPAIMLDMVHNYIDVTVPSWWLIDFLIGMGYLFFAVSSLAERDTSQT